MIANSTSVCSSSIVSIVTKTTQQRPRPRPVRPTLSDQLASIGAQADSLTSQIRKTHGLDATTPSSFTTLGPVCTFPAHAFAVGRLECRFPSPVQFFRDRCEYTFHHPFEAAEIRMVMYYKGGWMQHTTPWVDCTSSSNPTTDSYDPVRSQLNLPNLAPSSLLSNPT